MTKKFIALCLAVTALAMILTGCEVTIGDDKQEVTLPIQEFKPDAEQIALINALDWDNESDEALQKQLESIVGFTLPPTQPAQTAPPLMPEGEAIDNAELLRLVRKVQDTFKSQTYYIKGNINNIMGGNSNSFVPITMAVDKDKLMMETTADFTSMAGNPLTSAITGDAGQAPASTGVSKVQAALIQAAIGRTIRMLLVGNTAYMMFPERNSFANLSAFAGEEGGDMGELAGEITKMFSQFAAEELPADKMKATKVKEGGNEYLCAAYTNVNEVDSVSEMADGLAGLAGGGKTTTTIKHYYLKGELKRLEVIMTIEGESKPTSMLIEIDSFSGKVDASLFETKGFSELNITELTKLFGGSLGATAAQ